MEILPYIQPSDAKDFVSTSGEKACFSPLQDADPVVYKLVRVDGNGRLIPATDDELLEVEDLLVDGKDELHIGEDIGVLSSEVVTDQSSSGNIGMDAHEVTGSQSSSWNERSPAADNEHITQCFASTSKNGSCFASTSKNGSCFASTSKNGSGICLESISACPNELNMVDDIAQSVSDDTILAEDDLCLKKLTVKELQAIFKSTFGRETSVKDRIWLKRRIAMGLANTYELPSTDFIMRGKTIIAPNVSKDCDSFSSLPDDSKVAFTDKLRTQGTLTDSGLVKHEVKYEELQNQEVRAPDGVSKRVRKPTKRYITELSDVETQESGGRSLSATKTSERISFPESHLNSAPADESERHDPFAAISFQIPHVSRVRRGRPRQDYVAFRNYQPNRLDTYDTDDEQNSRIKGRSQNKIYNGAITVRIQQAAGEHPDQVTDSKQLGSLALNRKLQDGADIIKGMLGDRHADGNAATFPTAKGSMPHRKQHLAWTLSEVEKLVDGVSRFGVGKWSEIKRGLFPSYTCRTPVDLKDKWRNLMKAISSYKPKESASSWKVPYPRKQASIPIPPNILDRVRELAMRHSAHIQSKPKSAVAQTNNFSVNPREIKS